MLAGGAARGDVTPVLAESRRIAAGLGARLLLAEVTALARRSRIDLDAEPVESPADDLATDGAEFGLTPRECEVLALLTEGRTNRQIAETLFISGKTVSVHVSNLMAKLGVGNRLEAAAMAHRLGMA
jgi:DNA-binding NarL/FixJ family response regulator